MNHFFVVQGIKKLIEKLLKMRHPLQMLPSKDFDWCKEFETFRFVQHHWLVTLINVRTSF